MNQVSVDSMVQHIRSMLDENETNSQLSGVNGVRQLTVEDVIKSMLVAGVDTITNLAPAYMIEATSSTYATTDKHLIIPSNALKVLWLKANGWNRSMYEVHDASEQLYKIAVHGRVGSVCNANSPLAFELSESFNPYGSEELIFTGKVDKLPTQATEGQVYYLTTDSHTYKCKTSYVLEHYELETYNNGDTITDNAINEDLLGLNYGQVIDIEIEDEDYYITLMKESDTSYFYITCDETGYYDQDSQYVDVNEAMDKLCFNGYDHVCKQRVPQSATYTDLGILPTNETTARVIQCFPEPSGTPVGWIQYAKKAEIANDKINVSEKLYDVCCMYIAGLTCDAFGWPKATAYKQDAVAMLNLPTAMQVPMSTDNTQQG